ncbi:MAG: outer membrane protein assembly factor [Gammaproteobacteria bacterium]|nr:outer membrane protein assembly factor [Gammaproteobacteria bacterium]
MTPGDLERAAIIATARKWWEYAGRRKFAAGLALLVASMVGQPAAHAKGRIDINGVSNSLEQAIRDSLTLSQETERASTPPARVRLLYRRAREELDQLLQSRGYYRAQIDSDLSFPDTQWLATFNIDRGQRITLSKVEVTAGPAEDEEIAAAVASFPLKPGNRLVHATYERGKEDLYRTALARGFLDASYAAHQIQVDLNEYSAYLELNLVTGERYRFGTVTFSDNRLNDSLLRSLVPFAEGDFYTAADVLELQRRLQNTEYFSLVEVRPDLSLAGTGQPIPVQVDLNMNNRNKYTIGAGFGTDSGPRGTLSWQNRYLNRRGHRATADLHASPVTSDLLLGYAIPFFRNPESTLTFSTRVAHEDTDSRTSDAFELAVRHSTVRWGWQETAGLSYLLERFTVADEPRTSSQMVIPSIGWSRTRADDPLFPSRGYSLGLAVQGASNTLLSSTSFLQVKTRAKYIHSFGEKDRVLLRGEVGVLNTSQFDELPASLRFFAGGDVSIRGFDYQALGPRDDDNKVIGGRYLTVGSVEYEHRLTGSWGVALFSDFGNAFNSFNDSFAYSGGVGARWRSPVGMIRVDVAVGHLSGDRSYRLHIGFGPDL